MDQKVTIDTREIEDALHALLTQIVHLDRTGSSRPFRPDRYRPYTMTELSAMTHLEDLTHELIDDPVRNACAQAVRVLGQRLHEMGLDGDEMEALAAKVISRGRKNQGKKRAVIDARWNGIGEWHS